jgi:hypothetical protein
LDQGQQAEKDRRTGADGGKDDAAEDGVFFGSSGHNVF